MKKSAATNKPVRSFAEDFQTDSARASKAAEKASVEQSDAFKQRTSELTAFRVFSRVRPFIAEELAEMGGQERRSIVEVSENRTILLDPNANWAPKAQYEFDASFWSIPADHKLVHTFADTKHSRFTSQRDVYEMVAKDLVGHVFKGYNSCILTYGQTGSGKTYTMMGQYDPRVPCGGDGPEGIIPRVSNDLFALLGQRQRQDRGEGGSKVEYHVEVSFVEIYMERVRDLLDPSLRNSKGSDRLHDARIRQDPYSGPFVEGVTKYQVENWGQCCVLLERGSMHRTTCATAVHNQSSRSHAIYQLTVIRTETHPPKGRYDHPTVSTQSGRINLVDLAGSERGGFQGYVKESAAINTSLLALRRCIDCLTERQNMLMEQLRTEITEGYHSERTLPQVPFRDSVLTWLLSDSIGGNARTTMIATLSPLVKNYGDTLATLQWSSKARNLVTLVKVNDQAMVKGGLASQRGQLGTSVQTARENLDNLRETLKKKQEKAEKLEREVGTIRETTSATLERTEMMLREMAAIIIQRAYQTCVFNRKLAALKKRRAALEEEVEKGKDSTSISRRIEESKKLEILAMERLHAAEQETENTAQAVSQKELAKSETAQRRFDVKVRNDRIRQRLTAEMAAKNTSAAGMTIAEKVAAEEAVRADHEKEMERMKKKIAEVKEAAKEEAAKPPLTPEPEVDTTQLDEQLKALTKKRDDVAAVRDEKRSQLRKIKS